MTKNYYKNEYSAAEWARLKEFANRYALGFAEGRTLATIDSTDEESRAITLGDCRTREQIAEAIHAAAESYARTEPTPVTRYTRAELGALLNALAAIELPERGARVYIDGYEVSADVMRAALANLKGAADIVGDALCF